MQLLFAILMAVDPYQPPPVVELRPDDTQIARVVAAWNAAGIETQTQVRTPAGGRCDLVAAGHAWEIEFDDLGVGGIGQSLFYAADLGLRPGMVLVRRTATDRYVTRTRLAADKAGVTLLVAPLDGDVPLPLVKETGETFTKESPRQAGFTRAPHIIATVADRGCDPCERWQRETLPALEAAGWRVQVNVVPFGSEAVPSFQFKGRRLSGYSSRDSFYAWLSPPSVSLPTGPPAGVRSTTLSAPAGFSIPPARRQWTYNGRDLAAHIRNVHGVDPTGMSYSDMVNAHSHAHEGTWSAVRGATRTPVIQQRAYYAAPVSQSTCPTCPGYRR